MVCTACLVVRLGNLALLGSGVLDGHIETFDGVLSVVNTTLLGVATDTTYIIDPVVSAEKGHSFTGNPIPVMVDEVKIVHDVTPLHC